MSQPLDAFLKAAGYFFHDASLCSRSICYVITFLRLWDTFYARTTVGHMVKIQTNITGLDIPNSCSKCEHCALQPIETMGFAVRVRSAGQKYGPTCHQRDRSDVTEFVTLVRLSSLGQRVGVLALAGYKRRKSALTAGPIRNPLLVMEL